MRLQDGLGKKLSNKNYITTDWVIPLAVDNAGLVSEEVSKDVDSVPRYSDSRDTTGHFAGLDDDWELYGEKKEVSTSLMFTELRAVIKAFIDKYERS